MFANGIVCGIFDSILQKNPVKTSSITGIKSDTKSFSTMRHIAKEHYFKIESQTKTVVLPTTELFFSCIDRKSMSDDGKVNDSCYLLLLGNSYQIRDFKFF